MPRSKEKLYLTMGVYEDDPAVQQFLALAHKRHMTPNAYATELFVSLLHSLFPEGERVQEGVFIPAGELLRRLETIVSTLSKGGVALASSALSLPVNAPLSKEEQQRREQQGKSNAAKVAALDDDDE